MKSFFKHIFYPVFFVIFLLSFFLIEGDYKFYLFAAWSIFLFLFSNFLDKKFFSRSIVYSIFLSVLFTIAFIFSKHIPLSLEKLLFYFSSLSLFVFFRSTSVNVFDKKIFFYYMSAVALVLNIFVLFFTFFDPQATMFPGMNLLVRSYGHNHYAAFLLLVVPIFWWQFLFAEDEEWISKKEIKFLAIILLLMSYLIIIFALARLILIISLLQLILIFFLNKKAFFISSKNEFARSLVKTFIFAFVSISLVFLFLSMPLNNNGDSLCPLVFSKKELCKSVLENDRFVYWNRAKLILVKNPYFGYGLKTFNFASRQLINDSHKITSYAHNIFLHNLAENGIFVGGFFVFFITYLFYKSFLIVRENKEPLNQFLWFAAVASLVNAMLDFDWHFFIIFSLTLIFLAMILRNHDHKQEKIIREISKPINLKIYFFIIAFITCFFAIAYFSAGFLRKTNKSDLVVTFLPYFNRQIRYLIDEDKLSEDKFEILHKLYKNDSSFIYSFSLLNDLSSERRSQLQIELSKLDPVHFIKNISFLNLDLKTAEPLIDEFFNTTNKYHFLDNYNFISHENRLDLFRQLILLAGKAYKDDQVALSAKFYQQAMLLNPFFTDNTNIVFLDETDFSKATVFLMNFKDFDPEKMHSHTNEYMLFYERTLIYLFQNNRLDDFFILTDSMLEKKPDFSTHLFNDLNNVSKTPAEKQRLIQVEEYLQIVK